MANTTWVKIRKGAYQIDGKKFRFIVRKDPYGTKWQVNAAELQETAGVRHTIGVQETIGIGREDSLKEAKEIVGIMLDTEVPEYNLHYEFRDAYASAAYAR